MNAFHWRTGDSTFGADLQRLKTHSGVTSRVREAVERKTGRAQGTISRISDKADLAISNAVRPDTLHVFTTKKRTQK